LQINGKNTTSRFTVSAGWSCGSSGSRTVKLLKAESCVTRFRGDFDDALAFISTKRNMRTPLTVYGCWAVWNSLPDGQWDLALSFDCFSQQLKTALFSALFSDN